MTFTTTTKELLTMTTTTTTTLDESVPGLWHPPAALAPTPPVAEDVSVAQAQALFPDARQAKAKAPLPVSPLPEFAAVERAYDSLAVPRRAPEARALAVDEARARILRSLDRSTPISASELDRRAAEQVDGVHWGATADRLAEALPALEVAVDTLAAAVERSHASRRDPRDPASVVDVGLRPDEQEARDETDAWRAERFLFSRLIEEQRLTRREQRDNRRATEAQTAALTITASTDVDDLLAFAEHGSPAEQRRADWLLSRRQVRASGDPAGAVAEHLAVQTRHQAIRDARVPHTIRQAEQAERDYLTQLRARVEFRIATARIVIRERGDLDGLFTVPDRDAAPLAQAREAAQAAWAPVWRRARATT